MAKLTAFLDGDEGAQEMRRALKKVEDSNEVIYKDINVSKEDAEGYGIEMTPALVVEGTSDFGARFYGIPRGKEEKSLKEAVRLANEGTTDLPDEAKEKVKEIDVPITIGVFTTPQCTYCPKGVKVALWFAHENENIRAEVIDATEFDELAMKFKITAVPTIVINGSVASTIQGSNKEYIEGIFNLIDHVMGHKHH